MRLTAERLAGITLARQFPTIRGRGRAAVRQLFDRLGPVQSQVPRAPFLFAASRLPGVAYGTIRDAFAVGDLLKATNLRGTVHTCRPAIFGALDGVSRRARENDHRRVLGLAEAGLSQAELITEIEAFCAGGHRQRSALSEHVLNWLAAHHATVRPGTSSSFATNLIWGHSGLIRQPADGRWERRTDTLHRTAVDAYGPGLAARDHPAAMVELARVHLAAYGPATRRDIAWWSGSSLGLVDRALAVLADELVQLRGPDGAELIDLADASSRSGADPGLRLLPEFDGLLLGYAPPHRGRFLDPDQLHRIWARANGMFSPVVLLDGRIVAGWRALPGRPATDTVIEVSPLGSPSPIGSASWDAPVADIAAALGLTVTEVRVLPTA